MNRTAIVTGASRGIGRASAKLFVDAGYSVINISRSACDVEGVQNLKVDMSTPGALEQNSPLILDTVGDSDEICLVHNAAMLLKDTTANVEPATFREVLELNVIAPAALNRLLLPKMKPGSSVIYIASTLGQKAVGNSCSYVTSKHALIGLMKSTCQDLVGSSIHTLAICPGFTETDLLEDSIKNIMETTGRDRAAAEKSLKAVNPQRRFIQPEEIATTAAFLCAPGSESITGQSLAVAGGEVM